MSKSRVPIALPQNEEKKIDFNMNYSRELDQEYKRYRKQIEMMNN